MNDFYINFSQTKKQKVYNSQLILAGDYDA